MKVSILLSIIDPRSETFLGEERKIDGSDKHSVPGLFIPILWMSLVHFLVDGD